MRIFIFDARPSLALTTPAEVTGLSYVIPGRQLFTIGVPERVIFSAVKRVADRAVSKRSCNHVVGKRLPRGGPPS